MKNEATFVGIFSELWSVIGTARQEFAIYVAVVGGLTAVGALADLTESSAGTLSFGFQLGAGRSLGTGLFDLFLTVVSTVAAYWLLTRYLAGKGRLRTENNRFWPYLGMAILSGFAVVLGLVLLIVPGLVLLVRWSAASGFLLGAGDGVTDSMRASWHATEGHGWAIFFAALVLFVGLMIGAGVIGAVAGAMGTTVVDVVTSIVESVTGGIFLAFGIAVYCLVHDDMDRLGEVFA